MDKFHYFQARQDLTNSGLQQQNIPVTELSRNIQGPVFQQQMFPPPLMHLQQYRQNQRHDQPVSIDSVSGVEENHDAGRNHKKRFVCNVCQKSYATKRTLKRHSVIHTGQYPFVCETCGKGFTVLSYLKRHKLQHTGERPHACEVCHKRFRQKGHLRDHMVTHTGETSHVCPICDGRFVRKQHLANHTRTHTGERPFVCEVCSEGFTQKNSLRSHRKTQHGNHLRNHKIFQPASNNNGPLDKKRDLIVSKKLPFHLPGGKSKNNLSLKIPNSQKQNVQKNEQISGPTLQRQIIAPTPMAEQAQFHQGRQDQQQEETPVSVDDDAYGICESYDDGRISKKKFFCSICEKSYYHKSSLNKHYRSHTGENRLFCEICGKGFSVKSSLKRHQLQHTVDRPHACEVCGKKFGQKGTLNKHMKIHTCEIGYVCHVCNRKFAQISELTIHIRTHKGEKPFVSDVCYKGFSQILNLNVHRKIHEIPHSETRRNSQPATTNKEVLKKQFHAQSDKNIESCLPREKPQHELAHSGLDAIQNHQLVRSTGAMENRDAIFLEDEHTHGTVQYRRETDSYSLQTTGQLGYRGRTSPFPENVVNPELDICQPSAVSADTEQRDLYIGLQFAGKTYYYDI